MTTAINRPGHDELWLWFGLSRSSFCILPRAFMHAMSDEWQAKMAALLNEWDDAWDWTDVGFDCPYVSVKKDGRYLKMPDFLINYRHPDYDRIDSFRTHP